jgi:uncharacterized protein
MLIAFALAGIILAGAMMAPLWSALTGMDAKSMEKGLSDPAFSNAAKVIQCVTAIFGFLLPAVITAAVLSRKPFNLLGYSRNVRWREAGLATGIMIAALFVSAALIYLNEKIPMVPSWKEIFDQLETDYNQRIRAILQLNSAADFALGVLTMAILPAICEETLFRGGMQNFLTRATGKGWLSIIVVSILFSAVHLSYYLFLPRFLLGLILGFIFHYSGKLWLSILVHFLNNALAITVVYINTKQGKPIEQAVGENTAAWQGILALPFLVALMYLFHKVTREGTPPGSAATVPSRTQTPSHGL